MAFEASRGHPARDRLESKPGLEVAAHIGHHERHSQGWEPSTLTLKGRWSKGIWEGDEEAGRVSPGSRILWARDENFSKEQVQPMSKGTRT